MRLAMPIYGKNARRELVTEFRGLNSTDMGGDGGGKSTFSDMLNGGTDKYPFAASRLSRRVTQYDEATCALSGGEALTRVQPPYLFYGDRQYDLGLTSGEKQIVRMGTNVLIFPDGKYFNTANGESGDIDEGEEYTKEEIKIRAVEIEGIGVATSYSNLGVYDVKINGSEHAACVRLDKFVDIEDTPLPDSIIGWSILVSACCPLAFKNRRLYRAKEWKTITSGSNIYYEDIIWEEMIIKSFFLESVPNDATNNWCKDKYVNLKVETLGDISSYKIELMPDQLIGDVITPTRLASNNVVYFSGTWKTRTLPFFDFVTVCNNRLWGCRYGIPYDGSEPVNRIYVSALNNFKAFEQFAAISTDSWWGDVSEEGLFTGACTYNGYPMFFKEDYLYILYGDYPPYSFAPIRVRGVAEGAAKSLVEINNALYYKSRHDIMRYTSSSLSSISDALGDISEVEHAVGGTYRDSYYISLDGALYVYDTAKGLWSKEDKLPVIDFANARGETHFLTEGGAVYTVNGGEESMEWSLTSPTIGYAYPNRKRLSSLQIRIEIGEGDELPTVELSLDGGEFKECSPRVNFIDGDGKRTGTIFIPILPGRCELFRYRISGKGSYKLTGVTKTLKECGK